MGLVEDAAHAHTSYLDGVGWAGTIGDIAAFSFFPTKVMSCGEGGMITTNSKVLHSACEEIKQFGREMGGSGSRFVCARPDGTNGRVPELTGLLGFLDCGRVKSRVARRQELMTEYAKALAGSPHYRVVQQPGGNCSYYKCILQLRGLLRQRGRDFLRNL